MNRLEKLFLLRFQRNHASGLTEQLLFLYYRDCRRGPFCLFDIPRYISLIISPVAKTVCLIAEEPHDSHENHMIYDGIHLKMTWISAFNIT